MSATAAEFAAAALQLAGSPFRLHGRDPATGLDCVGVCVAALHAIGRKVSVPTSYGLRNAKLDSFATVLSDAGLGVADGAPRPGDIVLLRLSAVQFHLMIAVPDGCFIHAHAGLRRVIKSPGPNVHPVMGHWRLLDLS